jgi:hypothetical protein
MPRVLVHLAMPVPIPVGHRVEVRVFVRETTVLFSSSKEPQPDQPVVTDLDTGVVFGPAWAFGGGGAYYKGKPLADLTLAPPPSLQEHSRVVGRVTACRVAWVTEFVSTTLELEQDG